MLIITFRWIWHRGRRRSLTFIRHSKEFFIIFQRFYAVFGGYALVTDSSPSSFSSSSTTSASTTTTFSASTTISTSRTFFWFRWPRHRNHFVCNMKWQKFFLNIPFNSEYFTFDRYYLDLYPTKTLPDANNRSLHCISLFQSYLTINLPHHHYLLRIFLL